MAKIMLSNANFLILDEPTNHLDLDSKQILENVINNYEGTVLYISHDRYFINSTAKTVLAMEKNGITKYLGNYDFYLEKTKIEEAETETVQTVKDTKIDWQKQKEEQALKRKKENQLAKLEERIEEIEEKIKEKFQSSRQITIGSLRLDLSDGHAYLNNADTGLTRTEFSLLRLLAENQEKIFSAKELYEAVWGSCAGTDTSTVRRHIFNLRTKIGAEDTDEYDIVSVYGKGYLFTCR